MAFQTVVSEAVLSGCFRKENAWNILRDYTRYPEFMENVDKVEIIERNGNVGMSRWFITVEDAPLAWIEKDLFDTPNYQIAFQSIEGDFDNINGRWSIIDNIDSGIAINFELQYNLGIPVIEEVLGHILQEKMKANLDTMMVGVTNELQRGVVEERRHVRYTVGRYHTFDMGAIPCRVFVRDISAGGMAAHYQPGMLPKGGTLAIDGITIDVESVYNSEALNRSQFVFRSEVPDETFRRLRAVLAGGSARLKPSIGP